jgi:hypothetical protein
MFIRKQQLILKSKKCSYLAGITNSVRLDDGGIVVWFPQWNEAFLCPKLEWLVLSHSQLLNHLIPSVLETEVMQLGRETERSSSFSAEVKEWMEIPPIPHTPVCDGAWPNTGDGFTHPTRGHITDDGYKALKIL